MAIYKFPEGFLWGVATSAQQIEGGRHEAGRRDSIWDQFATIPGKIADGSAPDVTCDHYHRWPEDIALMQKLGLNAYRFSLAWPRVLPAGRTAINDAGLDFYDALVDALLEAGIQPFPTLFHWDLPQDLQNRGGWGNRDTAEAFVELALAASRRLGDRVTHWVTHNEPWCIASLGHEEGHHAPGHRDPAEALRVAHHLLLSHGWATQAIREEAPQAEVGIVLNHCPVYPETSSEEDRKAARWFDGLFNRWYLDPLFKGCYPTDVIADRVAAGHLPGPVLPFVQQGDMAAIKTPIDFLGFNYYNRAILKSGPDGKPVNGARPAAAEVTDMGWEVFPQGLHDGLVRVHRDYDPPQIYITENGAAFADLRETDGRIRDSRRIAYLRDHLATAARSIESGVPLKGYMTWSLLDNFEWGYGFTKKFGLFSVDPHTQNRSPKDSAFWYRDIVAANAIDDSATSTTQGESRVF